MYLEGVGAHCGFWPQMVLKLLGDDLSVDVQVRNPVLVLDCGGGRHVDSFGRYSDVANLETDRLSPGPGRGWEGVFMGCLTCA